jgi:hypothetical protein
MNPNLCAIFTTITLARLPSYHFLVIREVPITLFFFAMRDSPTHSPRRFHALMTMVLRVVSIDGGYGLDTALRKPLL